MGDIYNFFVTDNDLSYMIFLLCKYNLCLLQIRQLLTHCIRESNLDFEFKYQIFAYIPAPIRFLMCIFLLIFLGLYYLILIRKL